MQGAIRSCAILLAALAAACAPTRDVRIDQRQDLARLHTWSFLPLAAASVRAPDADATALEKSLRWSIERCLRERGFVRVGEQPDFTVGYALEIRRQFVTRAETPATVSLPSLHDSPSYEIQASGHSVESYETGHLAIFVSEPGAQAPIWSGGFEGRLRGEIERELGDAVASVLGHVPVSASASRARPARSARGASDPVGQCSPPI